MSSDYLEQLDDSSLGLLAETAGMALARDGARFFSDRPHAIRQALGSPEAAILLNDAAIDDPNQRRLLQLHIPLDEGQDEGVCPTVVQIDDFLERNLLYFDPLLPLYFISPGLDAC